MHGSNRCLLFSKKEPKTKLYESVLELVSSSQVMCETSSF